VNQNAAYLESKKHYQILDGLRGVAAIMVVAFHVMETFSGGDRFHQLINHGYLAVDFFFLLSGFVVAYAYDDRWEKMTHWQFFKRRLVRLQPMVIMGSIVGAALFYCQQGEAFPLVASTPVWKLLLVMLVGCSLIPVTPAMDIRGWQEMHPLDGPAWSLFFEYVANILYALVIRRLPQIALAVLVALFGGLLVHYCVTGTQGDVIGGWSVDKTQLRIGFTRMLFPFFAGMLLCRMGTIIRLKGAFWLCSLLLIVVLSLPRFGGKEHLWLNGLYESLCIIAIFPLIVAIGAGGNLSGRKSTAFCKFLGDISYPLYITHYPLIYVLTAWTANHKVPLKSGLPAGALLLVASILLAYACVKLYDVPVRNWLTQKVLRNRR
jgi:peptidoglycan/LPS O-acetylase OafA/YrhL